MFHRLRLYIFSLYERSLVRNTFYTIAFAILVPIGYRLAQFAWKFGGDFDRLLTVIGGISAGATAAVTLLRVWTVPPSRTVAPSPTEHEEPHEELLSNGSELLDRIRGYSARNLQIAQGARALGLPPRRLYR